MSEPFNAKAYAQSIIFESDLPRDFPAEKVPEVVDGAIWVDRLEVTAEERQRIISTLIEILPSEAGEVNQEQEPEVSEGMFAEFEKANEEGKLNMFQEALSNISQLEGFIDERNSQIAQLTDFLEIIRSTCAKYRDLIHPSSEETLLGLIGGRAQRILDKIKREEVSA